MDSGYEYQDASGTSSSILFQVAQEEKCNIPSEITSRISLSCTGNYVVVKVGITYGLRVWLSPTLGIGDAPETACPPRSRKTSAPLKFGSEQ